MKSARLIMPTRRKGSDQPTPRRIEPMIAVMISATSCQWPISKSDGRNKQERHDVSDAASRIAPSHRSVLPMDAWRSLHADRRRNVACRNENKVRCRWHDAELGEPRRDENRQQNVNRRGRHTHAGMMHDDGGQD